MKKVQYGDAAARTHIKRYAATLPHLTFFILHKIFKFSDFNKEHTRSLKMI